MNLKINQNVLKQDSQKSSYSIDIMFYGFDDSVRYTGYVGNVYENDEYPRELAFKSLSFDCNSSEEVINKIENIVNFRTEWFETYED
ncbi:MAG TPA: hypothetical protein EYG85_06400 [Crocinitomix sp.]|nr:hypothetical protein [Crocinitomix sp.]